jgi:hypothetical protein
LIWQSKLLIKERCPKNAMLFLTKKRNGWNNNKNSYRAFCVDGSTSLDLQQAKIQKEHTAIFCGYRLQNCGHTHNCVWHNWFNTVFS